MLRRLILSLMLCVATIFGCAGEEDAPSSSTEETRQPETPETTTAAVGTDAAPDTDSPVPAETTIRVATPEEYQALIESHQGQVVLVDFWATWCVECRKRFPHTAEMARQLADEGLVVVTVAIDDPDSKADALEFLKEQRIESVNLLAAAGADEASFVAYEITTGALPHYKIYGRDGTLAKTFLFDATAESTFTSDDVEAAVREAIALGKSGK